MEVDIASWIGRTNRPHQRTKHALQTLYEHDDHNPFERQAFSPVVLRSNLDTTAPFEQSNSRVHQ
jgi:hypothetical protein